MLKCAVAGAEMALFVCHSAEHHFTEKTFLPKFADREKKGGGGGKELKLGFWESLVGAQSLAHCGSVTLTFGNGEGEKRVKKKEKLTFLSCLLPYKLFCHCSQFSEPAVIEPSNHMNIHDKFALLFCPLSWIFFSPRDLSCCV